jgi:hypothetical protein
MMGVKEFCKAVIEKGLFLFFLLDSRRFVFLVLPEAGVRTVGNRILLPEKTRLTS